jgi:hypothetical protein
VYCWYHLRTVSREEIEVQFANFNYSKIVVLSSLLV